MKAVLTWGAAAKIVAVGLFLMLLGLATYEASEHLRVLPPPVRLPLFVAFLGGVFGYSANRVLKALAYEPWQQRP